MPQDALPILLCESQRVWEDWLTDSHASGQGVWLKLAKKAAPIPTVTYDEAVESALCFGWIDGQKAAHDETHFLQRFTPRRAKSGWSKVNRAKAEALIAAGRMRPAGVLQVERAQANGRWDAAYDSSRTISMPPDFATALDENPTALASFATLDNNNRYAFLRRIQIATTAQLRAKRIQQFVAMLAAGQKLHP